MNAITNKYDFVYLFDVSNGNPNGDPDNGNTPRQDPETGRGLVTDVCIKRKVRNYVEAVHGGEAPYEIYVKAGVVLNNQNRRGWDAVGVSADNKDLAKKGSTEHGAAITRWMCDNFFDVRTFGAVMTTGVNSGQVRGPVQFGFAESIDQIVPAEVTITRQSVTNEEKADAGATMGSKFIVPYGLYRQHGHISAALAGNGEKGSGFSQDDLDLLWKALSEMFDFDRSATRGEMEARRLVVFKHSSALGNAPARELMRRVTVTRKEGVELARNFEDYEVIIDRTNLPEGVKIIEMI